jgi:hypothetical protein
MIAGGVCAQDQPPSRGQFFPPTPQFPRPAPFVFVPPTLKAPLPLPLTIRDLPAPNPYVAVPPSRCAVPLIEMKIPAAADSIARTPSPQAMADPIAVPPPVPACNADAPTAGSPYATNRAERLKQLKELQQVELERIKQLRENQQAEPAK